MKASQIKGMSVLSINDGLRLGVRSAAIVEDVPTHNAGARIRVEFVQLPVAPASHVGGGLPWALGPSSLQGRRRHSNSDQATMLE